MLREKTERALTSSPSLARREELPALDWQKAETRLKTPSHRRGQL